MGIEVVLCVVARDQLGERNLEYSGKGCKKFLESLTDILIWIDFLLRKGHLRDIDLGDIDILRDGHLGQVLISGQLDRSFHGVFVKCCSGVVFRFEQVVSHKERSSAIVLQSGLKASYRGNSVPTGLIKIARVGSSRESSIGDCARVGVGDWGVMSCIHTVSFRSKDNVMEEMPSGTFSSDIGIGSLQPFGGGGGRG